MANHKIPCHRATCSLCPRPSSISWFLFPLECLRNTHTSKENNTMFSFNSSINIRDCPIWCPTDQTCKAPLMALGYPGAQTRNLVADPSVFFLLYMQMISWCFCLLSVLPHDLRSQFLQLRSGPGFLWSLNQSLNWMSSIPSHHTLSQICSQDWGWGEGKSL